MASEVSDLKPGDWVRITRAPNGYADHVRQAVGAAITYKSDTSLEVSLYDKRGKLIMSNLGLLVSRVAKIDKPVFETLTSGLPETPELLAAKDLIYQHAMVVGRRTGMCSVLDDALDELGIHKPPPGKVKVHLTLEIEVDPEKIIRYTDWRSFPAAFEAYSASDKARSVFGAAGFDQAVVAYEVIPPPERAMGPEPMTPAEPETEDSEEELDSLEAEPIPDRPRVLV